MEMTAVVTSEALANDVAGAEACINRHKEYNAEIEARVKDFIRFTQTGQKLIKDGHFLSDEVKN